MPYILEDLDEFVGHRIELANILLESKNSEHLMLLLVSNSGLQEDVVLCELLLRISPNYNNYPQEYYCLPSGAQIDYGFNEDQLNFLNPSTQ